MQKKVLLTGATGFLGSQLLGSLISQGFEVSILIRSTSNTRRITHLLEKVNTYNIDEITLKSIFEKACPELTIHTACSYGRNKESSIEIINSNLIFGLDLLEESINHNVKLFINTDSLLPRDLNEYSLSKAQFTDWLRMRSDKIQIINFKIELIYGVGDDDKKFISKLINEMLNNDGMINLTSGTQMRDFIYVTDVVDAYNICIQKNRFLPEWSEFDIGTGVNTQVREFVLTLAKLLEKKIKKNIVGRLNFGSIPYRKNEIMNPLLDNTKLMTLGWEHQVGIKEGISKLLTDFI